MDVRCQGDGGVPLVLVQVAGAVRLDSGTGGGPSPGMEVAGCPQQRARRSLRVCYALSLHKYVDGWIQSSRTNLHTKSAERLADAAVAMTSQEWHNTAMSQTSF